MVEGGVVGGVIGGGVVGASSGYVRASPRLKQDAPHRKDDT